MSHSIKDCLLLHSGTGCLQVGHKGLQVLEGHILAGIAQLMDDAVLDLGLGEGSRDHCVKTRQIAGTGDENILYSPVFRPLSTVFQNLVFSFSAIHILRTFFRPSRLTPMTMYTASFTICPSLRT